MLPVFIIQIYIFRFIYSDENDRKYRKTLIKKFVTGVIGVCKGEFWVNWTEEISEELLTEKFWNW